MLFPHYIFSGKQTQRPSFSMYLTLEHEVQLHLISQMLQRQTASACRCFVGELLQRRPY